MPPQLIRLLPDGRAQWRDDVGATRDGWPPAADRRVPNIVLVPGEHVLLLQVPRPARDARQMALALPFAIEDRLAGVIEDQHVAWADSDDPVQVRVAVVARARMAAWLESLAAAGIDADVLLPEPLALELSPGDRGRALFDGDRVVWRDATGGQTMAAAEFEALRAARVLDVPSGGMLGTPSGPANAAENPGPRAVDVLSVLGAGAEQPALNLLQGEYHPRHRARALARTWRLAAALAGAAVLLAFAQALADHAKLSSLAAEQRLELRQLQARFAPDAAPGIDPLAHLRTRLGGNPEGRDDALSLLTRAAPALAADPRISLEALDYRADQMALMVVAVDVASLDALRQRLGEAGLDADITASTPGAGGVMGRLTVAVVP